jgi:hypothetical protein
VIFAVYFNSMGRNITVSENNTAYYLTQVGAYIEGGGGTSVYALILSLNTGQNRNVKARKKFSEEGKKSSLLE